MRNNHSRYMKCILIFLFTGTILTLSAGEHEKYKFKIFSVSVDLPAPYHESELTVSCNRSSVGEIFSADTTRQILKMELITKTGTIVIPATVYENLYDPDYPKISSFLLKEGNAVFINMNGFNRDQKKCNLWIKIIDHKIVDTRITEIELLTN